MADIKTRIKLKYDSFENWTTTNPTLLAGEAAVAYIQTGTTQEVNSVTPPQVLIKVGPGAFNTLPFISAKAADVYSWAKKSETDFIAWLKTQTVYQAGAELAITGNTIGHQQKLAGGFVGTAAAGAATANGKTTTVVVPKLTVNEYGHITAAEEVITSITIPTPVDISGKTDKVVPEATNNIAVLGEDGNLADGGQTISQVLSTAASDATSKANQAETNAKAYADELVEGIPAQTDYTVTIASTTSGLGDSVAKRYTFTQNGSQIGTIDLAKDLVVTSGSVKEVETADTPYDGAAIGDKYIELVIANQEEPIYIPAKDLVDIYTGKTGEITISNVNEISLDSALKAKIDGAVQNTTTVSAGSGLTGGGALSSNITIGLDSATIASLGKADTAVQPAVTDALAARLTTIEGSGAGSIAKALADAKAYTDSSIGEIGDVTVKEYVDTAIEAVDAAGVAEQITALQTSKADKTETIKAITADTATEQGHVKFNYTKADGTGAVSVDCAVNGLNGLAYKNTVGTADIDNGSITSDKFSTEIFIFDSGSATQVI